MLQAVLRTITPVEGPGTQSPTQQCLFITYNVPLTMPLSVVNLPANDCHLSRNWASAHGVALRQRTVRQETTMAKHGTLPECLYQRHFEVGDKVCKI